MNKLVYLLLVFFSLLQSCKLNEAEVQPDKPVPPAGVNISHVVQGVSVALTGTKAILVKPADSNPNTHLTTLFQVDANNVITPLIENFEVKDVRVTTNGIYVLTNYATGNAPIAFFAKYDGTWTQLKEVGLESQGMLAFKGENDNGNIVFSNGAILNTKTLQLDRSHILTGGSYIEMISGNNSLINTNGNRSVMNQITHAAYAISWGFEPDGGSTGSHIVSFKNSDIALVNNGLFDMRTGISTYLDEYVLRLTEGALRLDDGSIAVLNKPYEVKWSGQYVFGESVLAFLSVRYGEDGHIYTKNISRISGFYPAYNSGLVHNKILLKAGKYYVVREQDKIKVFDGKITVSILEGITMSTIAVKESSLFYSGTKNGQSVTGVYNLDTKQNIVLDNTSYLNVQPL